MHPHIQSSGLRAELLLKQVLLKQHKVFILLISPKSLSMKRGLACNLEQMSRNNLISLVPKLLKEWPPLAVDNPSRKGLPFNLEALREEGNLTGWPTKCPL